MTTYKLEQFDKIYVLVSGGIDSTYLYEKLKRFYKDKVYPVNCFNPYEQSKTLDQISKDPNFIQVKPAKQYNYGEILRESFLKLPEAYSLLTIQRENRRMIKRLYKEGKIEEFVYKKEIIRQYYHKKIFPCCYYIKHKSFFNNNLFKELNTVIISGIKRGDGTQRRIWLTQLSKGQEPKNQSDGKPNFFHKHLGGQLYCYPFRDYTFRELPNICVRKLRKKYPDLDHSGYEICPVLVLFKITNEKRYKKSLKYAQNLNVSKILNIGNIKSNLKYWLNE